MKLSQLVYLSVKNSIYYDSKEFTYQAFLNGDFDYDKDYSLTINNVFTPINEAIARLSDLERIPYIVYELDKSLIVKNNVIKLHEIPQFPYFIKEIKNIFQLGENGEYRSIAFKKLGNHTIYLNDNYSKSLNVFLEFKEDIPAFNELHIKDGEDIDLQKRYGISASASQYIIEFVKGYLLETIDPELANLHHARAEQYFMGLNVNKNTFHQDKVEKAYRI